ncbi:MAG: threonine--tRNA ligase [Clostridia bacterium]|nr:threonine--tRNA ligase [Clostridia bacterium]
MINITLKNNVVKQFNKGVKVFEVAKSIGPGLYNDMCAAKMDGKLVDVQTELQNDCRLEILTFADKAGQQTYWHTTSHIMAQAVCRLFKDVKLAIGPAIDEGFYYDFDIGSPITPQDLVKIEEEMQKIVKEDLQIERYSLTPEEAIRFMRERNQPYKVELIEDLISKGATLTFRQQGEFVDLCGGTHLLSTGRVKNFKLLSCTGAYWRGDSKKPMLQRIYGISFPKKQMLDEYLERIEEAKKRDHRKLGRELELYGIFDEGPGFPFFFANGMVLRNTLEEFWRKKHKEAGYVEIKTPIILNKDLWLRSGHWDHYKNNMYTTKIDEEDYAIKPMNCPGGMLVYKSKMHSYRDLPERVAELGLVHRHELSGVLHGLMRVRCFTQDDAHIFMTENQVESEIANVMKLIDYFYSIFGFKYSIELSTRPENSMGTDEQWEKATEALQNALVANNREYTINEGDGAFYGPKIDFHLEDSLKRTWQCGTIQLDFQLPERFDLTYIGEDGLKHRPIMLHRVIFGSIERFIGILTEHFAGAFPLWLSPVQVIVLPISEAFSQEAEKIQLSLKKLNIRADLDTKIEIIGYKIRNAQIKKIPYMLIVGQKELDTNTVSVRSRADGDLGSMNLDDFIALVEKEIATKEIK